MSTGRSLTLRTSLRRTLLPILLAAAVLTGHATPTIEAAFGFAGHVVPERYAPLHVRIGGVEDGTKAHLVVTQTLGNEWRDTSTVRQQLGLTIASDGRFETTVPLYEPLNPVSLALISDDGTILAETTALLRATRRLEPFRLMYGSFPFPDDGDPVTASTLPSDWWAYDTVRSLWIVEPPPQQAWDAIARWALSGGSVVLVAGSDYFRFDSPVLRKLLPISAPRLEPLGADGLVLVGSPVPEAVTAVSRDDVPLLIRRPYGAGQMSVLTVDAGDLAPSEIEAIVEAVPDAARLSVTPVSEALLGDLPVAQPRHASALLIIGCSIAALLIVVFIGRRWRWAGVGCGVSLFTLLCVWSGFVVNHDTGIASIYRFYAHFHIATSFGIDVVSLSFFAAEADPRVHPFDLATIPLQVTSSPLNPHPIYSFMPQPTATPWVYEHTAEPGRIVTSAAEIGQKTFASYGTSSPAVRLSINSGDGGIVLDVLHEDLPLADGWIVVDGRGTRLAAVSPGRQIVALDSADFVSLGALSGDATDSAALVLQHVSELFPLHSGIWFIGVSTSHDVPPPLPDEKVRHLDAYIVQGEAG